MRNRWGQPFRHRAYRALTEVFVTTKLWNTDQGYNSALKAAQKSLRNLGVEYLDLYLVHWPLPESRRDSWRALEKLLADGKTRAIGVSNYMEHHLEELATYANVPPAINQIELSPYNYRSRQGVVNWCQRHQVVLEAYSPLTRGLKLDDPKLLEVAHKYGKSAAQVLIRWCLERGLVSLPKSTAPARIRQNADIFDFRLGPQDMADLEALDENLATNWDPTNAP